MRVYAVIHSVESLDEGYSETSVKFFDYAKGAWDEMQSIQDSLSEWDDRCSDSFDRDFGDTTAFIPRIEWGETRRFIYRDDDSPNQVLTFFSFWRPSGDWSLVYNQADNVPTIAKTLAVVREMVFRRGQLHDFDYDLDDVLEEYCDKGHTLIDVDEHCCHYFVVSPILSDPTLPF